jgi:large subunit ribosomal protein L21
MYAILKHGGHQYRVRSGDRLLVDRIGAEIGSTVRLEPVLFVGDANGSAEGGEVSPAGARVTATVVAHRRGRKLRVFTYKPKKRRRRMLGYRSQLTELRIDEVQTEPAKPAKRSSARPKRELQAESSAAEPVEAQPTARQHAGDDEAETGARPRRSTRAPRKRAESRDGT